MHGTASDSGADLLDALRAHARDAVAFQSVESGTRTFTASAGIQPYVDTGTSWLGIGRPLAAPADVPVVAREFEEAARTNGRRVSFVGVEELDAFASYDTILLGEQAIYVPREWPAVLASKKSLREQLRRARRKGVVVRRVDPSELVPGSALRVRVRELAIAWLASRRIEPLQFLVALEPFHHPAEHRYFVAEHDGSVIAFASVIPIYARNGFMLEDVVRAAHVPNGTTELVFDAVMRDLEQASMVTLGLAPLAGDVPAPLRLLRSISRPLYDFEGLHAFKQRLQPARWDRVHLVLPPGDSGLLHVLECLRAFAGGSLVRFGVLSLVRHESGPPWALVIPLVAWILVRLAFAVSGGSAHFGSDATTILAWSMLDVVLAVLLFRAALRRRSRSLVAATIVAALVAVRSTCHVVEVGLGTGVVDAVLRAVMVAAPSVGTLALAWAARRRLAFERGEFPPLDLPHV